MLLGIGFEEYFDDESIVPIEWNENAEGFLPEGLKKVRISYGRTENERFFDMEDM